MMHGTKGSGCGVEGHERSKKRKRQERKQRGDNLSAGLATLHLLLADFWYGVGGAGGLD